MQISELGTLVSRNRNSLIFLQDAFSYFDTDHDGIVTTKLLGPLLRHCGENPSEAEVQVWQQTPNPKGSER